MGLLNAPTTDQEVLRVFENSREFRKADFKAITKSLGTNRKKEIVQTLLDLKYNESIKSQEDARIDWNSSDFQVVQASSQAASHYISEITGMERSQADFQKLFPEVVTMKTELGSFTGLVNENNYIDKADRFIENKDRIREIAKVIAKTQKFIKTNLVKANGMNQFINNLQIELTKASVKGVDFDTLIGDFNKIFEQHLVDEFPALQQTAIAIKDKYYSLMVEENGKMKQAYQAVVKKAGRILAELQKHPEELNRSLLHQGQNMRTFASQKIFDNVSLEFHISCRNSHLSLSEMQSAVALAPTKESELDLIMAQIRTKADKPDPGSAIPKKVRLKIPKHVMKVRDYRNLLTAHIKHIANIPDDEEIEVDIE